MGKETPQETHLKVSKTRTKLSFAATWMQLEAIIIIIIIIETGSYSVTQAGVQ